MIRNMFSFSATETGYNHIKAKPSKVCEDASSYYDDDQMHICVVADGHGSDNYPRTDRGSQFAVNAAIEQIRTFVCSIYNPDPNNAETSKTESKELIEKLLYKNISEYHPLIGLSRSILNAWRAQVEIDVNEHPFREEELVNVSEKYKKRYMSDNVNDRRCEKAYGCTLIAYVVTDEFSFGLQIGDGKCVVVDQRGIFSEPIPWDDNCQMNVTTSICDSDASDEFRFFVTNEKPATVFCGSDGIDDSYANVEEMYALYRSILKIFAEHGIEVGESEIKEYLPVLTKRGSGDDVSIGLIMDIQRIKELAPVFTAQTELFNLENQLKERQHTVVVDEEKEKSLCSKLSPWIKPGNKEAINGKIVEQINDLRVKIMQLGEEISTIQRKIESINLRMPGIIAECEPDMVEVLKKIYDNSGENDGVEEIPEDVMSEYVELALRVGGVEEGTKATATGIVSEDAKMIKKEVQPEITDNKFLTPNTELSEEAGREVKDVSKEETQAEAIEMIECEKEILPEGADVNVEENQPEVVDSITSDIHIVITETSEEISAEVEEESQNTKTKDIFADIQDDESFTIVEENQSETVEVVEITAPSTETNIVSEEDNTISKVVGVKLEDNLSGNMPD